MLNHNVNRGRRLFICNTKYNENESEVLKICSIHYTLMITYHIAILLWRFAGVF